MNTTKREEQILILSKCIADSIDINDFRWDKFFILWYREKGNPLFFLFKKNLSVTNTQYLELFSLISRYSDKVFCNSCDKKLLFYSTEHIRSTFSEIINTLLENFSASKEELIKDFAAMYIDVFSSTVAVDMFFGSCAVFLPSGVDINLDRVVHDSGYIHSAGKSIFIRNIKKSKMNIFIQNLEDYISNHKNNQIPFIIYAHEDFDGWDKASSDLLDRGIEQCKIFVDKMSMGSYRLGSILQEMKKNQVLNKKLLIPNPGNYQKEHNFKKESSVWLITDKSISGTTIKNPGANRYYICFEQLIKNESPLYFFDENKPAWKSHTTLPQSLTAALINIARPIAKDGNVIDPFGGTGTTWLEIKRLQLSINVNSSDYSPITRLLHRDNLDFFRLSFKEMSKYKNDFNSLSKMKSKDMAQFDLSFENEENKEYSYKFAKGMLDELKAEQDDQDQEFYISDSYVQRLEEVSLFDRIVFYLTLRAQIRFHAALERKSITFENAFKKSLKSLIDQITLLLGLRKSVENELNTGKAIVEDTYIKYISTYSYSIISKLFINDNLDNVVQFNTEVVSSMDARRINSKSYDLIICDPPYGFNTTENNNKLMELYSEFIDTAISCLKPNGQLIICLPAESYTGKDLPFCTRSDIVSRQIILKANQQNRQVYRPLTSFPITSLTPPYYWESEKALRRTILHFCFK